MKPYIIRRLIAAALAAFWNHYGDHVTHWMPFPTFNQK